MKNEMSPIDDLRTPTSSVQPAPGFRHYQLLRHQFQFRPPAHTPLAFAPSCVRHYNQLHLALVPAVAGYSTKFRRRKRGPTSSDRKTRALAPTRRRHLHENVGASPTWQQSIDSSTTAASRTPTLHHCTTPQQSCASRQALWHTSATEGTEAETSPSRHRQHIVSGACLTANSKRSHLVTPSTPEPSTRAIKRENTRQPTERGMTASNVSSIPASVREVISAHIPGVDVKEILRVEHFSKMRPVSRIRIEGSQGEWDEDGTSRVVALVFPHNLSFKPLRSEQWLFRSEGLILKWLGDTLGGRKKSSEEKSASEDGSQMVGEKNQQETRDHLRPGFQVEEILAYLPRLLYHTEAVDNPLRSAYTLLSTLPGIPLPSTTISASSLPTPTSSPVTAKMSTNTVPDISSPATHPNVARALGTLYQHLANLNSPNGKFGPAAAVLSEPDPDRLLAGAQGMMYSGGARDWETAFRSLFESVLRDGEDMTITLPYASLRAQMSRLQKVLNRVTEARLCLVEVPEEAICVAKGRGGKHWVPNAPEADAADNETGNTRKAAAAGGGDMELSGISDWSSAFFGDPLLSTAFTAAIPSADATDNKGFLAGFAGISADEIDVSDPLTWASSPMCPIEDPANAKARILLYVAFHATVAVVREYYRQTNESSRLELAARKRLNGILAELQEVKIVDLEHEPGDGKEMGNVKEESKGKCSKCGDENRKAGTPNQRGFANIEHRPSCKLSPAKKPKVESTK